MSTSSANSSFIILILLFQSVINNAQWSNYNQLLDSGDGTSSVPFKQLLRTGGSTYIYQQGTELVVYRWNTPLNQMDFVQRIKPSDMSPSFTTFSSADVFNKTIIVADSTNAGAIYVFRQPQISHPLEPFVLVQTITGQISNGQMGSRIFLDNNQLLVRSRNVSLNLHNLLSVFTRTSSTTNFGTTPEIVDTKILKKSAHFIHIFRNTIAVSEYESKKVHIFDRGNNGFTHFQEILPPSNFNGGLGYCTTFFHNTLIACNNGANICGTWKRSGFGSRFFQTQTLMAVPAPATGGRLFGIECQMEGNLAVIGQRGTGERGYAFLFLRNDSSKPYEFRQYIQGRWQRHFATRIDVGYPFVTVGHDLNNGRVFLYRTTAPESLINPAIAFPTTAKPSSQLDVGATFSGVSGLPPSWTSGGDPCGFVGVTCGADGTIQTISLAGGNLTGEMNLQALPKVARMDFSGNPGLNGTLDVKSFPTVLIVINIINTGISGTFNPKDIRANVTFIASTSLFCICPDGKLAGPRTNSTCTGPIDCAATCPCPKTDARTVALNQVSSLSFILLASVACFYVLIGFIGYCVAMKNEQQNYRFWVFLGGTLSSMDMYSDVAFVFTLLALNQQFLALASIVFIVLPVIANVIGTVMLISNWKGTSVLQSHVHRWTERFGFFLATFFVLTGSTYGAISLANCYLFGWPAYSMGIPRRFRESVSFSHLVTTVILENIPQVLIQLVFLLTTPSQFTLTPLFAMVTSIAVILRTTIKFLVQYANRTSGNEFEDWIRYEIESDELRQRYEEVRVKTHKFRTATAIALEKDVADTDMLPIVRLREDAIQVTVSIRTLASEDITPGFDSLVLSDSSLANAIQKKFKLKETPRIVKLEHLGRLNQADGFACGVCKRSQSEHRMTAVALASTGDSELVTTPRSEVDRESGAAVPTRGGRVWSASDVATAEAEGYEGQEGQEGEGGATDAQYPDENGMDYAAKHVSTNALP